MELLRTRLCPWQPVGIDALALAPSPAVGTLAAEPRLALGRANGSVELWDTTTWHMRLTSLACDKRSIRSIVWVPANADEGSAPPGLRLFTAGLSGEIVEWDVRTLEIQTSVASGGGAVWSMCVIGQRLLLSCEDGTVRIFSIEGGHDEIYHMRRIVVGEARLLSIAPFGSDFIFVGGSNSKITKWSLSSATCESRMQLDKTGPEQETLVWCLACLGDHGIASGDSLGMVTVWDPLACVVLHRFANHQADVLSLASSIDGNILVSASIDTTMSTYCRQQSGDQVWFLRNTDHGHTHDIRAAILDIGSEERKHIISGGVAGSMCVHKLQVSARDKQGAVLRCGGFSPSFQRAVVAQSSRVVMCQRNTHLELHYLQPPKNMIKRSSTPVPALVGVTELPPNNLPEPQLVVRHSLARAAEGHHLAASAITDKANLFAASDCSGTRMFRLSISELEVQREHDFPASLISVTARALLFCGEKLLVHAAWESHRLTIVDVHENKIAVQFSEHTAPVTLLASSGEWLASADVSGSVHLFNLDSLRHHVRVPAGSASEFLTAMSFDTAGKRLLMVLSTHKVLIYDIEAEKLAEDLPSRIPVPAKVLAQQERICGITPLLGNSRKVLLSGHNFLLSLDLDQLDRPRLTPREPRSPLLNAKQPQSPMLTAKSLSSPSLTAKDAPPTAAEPAKKRRKTGPLKKTYGDITDFSACAWRNYSKLNVKHILGLWALDSSRWGNALLENHVLQPGSGVKPDEVSADESTGDQRHMNVESMVLTLEVAPETVERSLPPAFERKKFQDTKK